METSTKRFSGFCCLTANLFRAGAELAAYDGANRLLHFFALLDPLGLGQKDLLGRGVNAWVGDGYKQAAGAAHYRVAPATLA